MRTLLIFILISIALVIKAQEVSLLKNLELSGKTEITKIVSQNNKIIVAGITERTYGHVGSYLGPSFIYYYDETGIKTDEIVFSGESAISDLDIYHDGSLILSGSFKEYLIMEGDTIAKMDQSDIGYFILRLNADGSVAWVNYDSQLEGYFAFCSEIMGNSIFSSIQSGFGATIRKINIASGNSVIWGDLPERMTISSIVTLEDDIYFTGQCESNVEIGGLKIPTTHFKTGYINYLVKADTMGTAKAIWSSDNITFDLRSKLIVHEDHLYSTIFEVVGKQEEKTYIKKWDSDLNTIDSFVFDSSMSFSLCNLSRDKNGIWILKNKYSSSYITYLDKDLDILDQFEISNSGFFRTETYSICSNKDKTFIVGGFYNDTLMVKDKSIPAKNLSIYDKDVFLLVLSQENTSFLDEISPLDLKIYPNPAKDHLTIETNDDEYTIRLFDINGKFLDTKYVKNQTGYYNYIFPSGMLPGVFFIEIHSTAFKETMRLLIR